MRARYLGILFVALAILAVFATSLGLHRPVADAPASAAADAHPPLAPYTGPDGVMCDEVGMRTSRRNCDDLTRTARAARKGSAAFSIPPMTRGETVKLQLGIALEPRAANVSISRSARPTPTPTPTRTPERHTAYRAHHHSRHHERWSRGGSVPTPEPSPERPEDIVSRLGSPVTIYDPIVGQHMLAELDGEGFTIEPKSPVSQDLHGGNVTTWEWNVTPVRSSAYSLTLKTAVQGEDDQGVFHVLKTTVRNEPVAVRVPIGYRIWDALEGLPDWLKLLGTVVGGLAALAAALWGLWRALHGKGDPPES